MSEELVHLSVAGGIATVTLDSPSNRNALSSALTAQLEERLQAAVADETVRMIVLTHAGPVFCSGADLKEASSGSAGGGSNDLVSILKLILFSPKPVVARVAGPARAGGIGLIAACDIAVAADTATFAFSEVRIGVIPAMISVVVLPKIGPAKGAELFLTGDTIYATEAARIGLINQAVADDELDDAVRHYGASLLKGAPDALAGCKRLVREVPGMSTDEAFKFTRALSTEFFASEEAREGMAAFSQKRPPRWAAPG